MELRFVLSGSVLFRTESNCAPTIGSAVRIRTESYKKGLHSGSLIEIPISSDGPPIFDFTEGHGAVVYIDLNGYELIEEGPSPD